MFVNVVYPKNDRGNVPEERHEVQVDPPRGATMDDVLADVWRRMNVVDGSDIELPAKLKCRSMMVGDVVSILGQHYVCCSMGWKQLPNDANLEQYLALSDDHRFIFAYRT